MTSFNILKLMLPPEEKIFYKLFEESTQICGEAAILFNVIVTEGCLSEENLIEAKTIKHRSADISNLILNQLNTTFITPIDREDIQLVSSMLNRITKKIIKACFNLRVYRLEHFNDNLLKQAATMVKATQELNFVVTHLKKVSESKEISLSHSRMKEIEAHGDDILYKAMDELFSGQFDALTVIKLRDIYKDIETALDTCFSVSDTIVNIVLKLG